MRLLSLQSAKAVSSRNAVVTTTWRALTSSSMCFEEAKPEPERRGGVPLAFDLSGISISKPAPRLTMLQKLAARHAEQAKAAEGGSTSPGEASENTLPRKDSNSKTHSESRTRNQGASSAPRRTQEGRGGAGRPSFPNGQRPASQGAQRNSYQNGERQPFQAGQRTETSRPSGRGQGKGGSAKASSRRKGPTGSRRGAAASSAHFISDPELNDYPSEGSNKPPLRTYDDEGLLKLKGVHVQLNPTIRPTLPKFAAQPIPSTNVFGAAEKAPVTDTLRILSYVDRAAPKPAAENMHNVLGVVDNADLALSRVRDLDVRHRRNALNIVQKMATPTSGAGKKPVASA